MSTPDYTVLRERAPNFHPPETPFGRNIFILDHKREHKFASIAKGGCTSLKYVAAEDDRVKFSDQGQLHELYSYRNGEDRVTLIGSDEYPEYTRVAFFKDPVKRFKSWYYDKVVYPYQSYIIEAGLYVNGSFERTVEFLTYELSKGDPEWIDEHVRPQAWTYGPDDIDVFVEIDHMNDYLRSIGVDVEERKNQSKASKSADIPEEIVNKIKKLYADDYQLYKDLEPKLWRPE